jgi:ribose-phosphate pyrophosphokinase
MTAATGPAKAAPTKAEPAVAAPVAATATVPAAESGQEGNGANGGQLRVFAGRTSRALAERVCDRLKLPLGAARIETFPDGETIVKVEEDVRGRDCYVVLSTCTPVNDNIMELLVYIDCLKRASAKRVTVVIPYYGYARQDRKDEGRVPITAKLVANVITAAGADRVLALDLHAAQIQGFFDLPVDHLSATPVFARYFQSIRAQMPDLCLLSPDVGNVKVAEAFANILGGELAIIFKRRISGSEVITDNIIGNVKGKTVLMFDDMIATGGTVCEAAELVMKMGAREVIAAATHGVMAGKAVERLAKAPITKIVITNTIPSGPRLDPIRTKLVELCVGDLIGDAIYNIHHNRSISALFKNNAGVKR